jgi:hypothetical protein
MIAKKKELTREGFLAKLRRAAKQASWHLVRWGEVGDYRYLIRAKPTDKSLIPEACPIELLGKKKRSGVSYLHEIGRKLGLDPDTRLEIILAADDDTRCSRDLREKLLEAVGLKEYGKG